jgi:hypothetical protein
MSSVMYYQFIIVTFITGLLWVMGMWNVGVMTNNGLLPPLSHPFGLIKVMPKRKWLRNWLRMKQSITEGDCGKRQQMQFTMM